MKIRNSCAALAVMLAAGVLSVSAGAMAQDAAASTGATAAVPPDAKALMEKARTAYKSLGTYQDKVELKFEMRAKDTEGNDQNQDDAEEMRFTFGGAKKFAMRHDDFAVVSDGKTQTAYIKFLNQYVEKPAQEKVMDEALAGPIGMLSGMHVPAQLLMAPAEAEKQFPLFKTVTDVKAEERQGKAGKRLVGTGVMPQMPFESPLPMTMWMDSETGMVGEVTIDLKKAYGDMMQGQITIDKAMGTISFIDAKTDATLPADAFVFTPGSDDKKVDAFQMDGGPDMQQELVGKPSPDFKGVDLEGKSLGISDFKGKVVVLDFWATWCPPCMEMIPQIQELSAAYADKGVVVLGMNIDAPNALERVKKTVETKKLTFRQFMDPESEVAEEFKVSGIPCTVIIDAKGVVQWIHTGGSPTAKQEISEKIDRLLKGESLVTSDGEKK